MGGLVSFRLSGSPEIRTGTVTGIDGKSIIVEDKAGKKWSTTADRTQVIDSIAELSDVELKEPEAPSVDTSATPAVKTTQEKFSSALGQYGANRSSDPYYDSGPAKVSPEKQAEIDALWNDGNPDREAVAKFLHANRNTRHEDWPEPYNAEIYGKAADRIFDPEAAKAREKAAHEKWMADSKKAQEIQHQEALERKAAAEAKYAEQMKANEEAFQQRQKEEAEKLKNGPKVNPGKADQSSFSNQLANYGSGNTGDPYYDIEVKTSPEKQAKIDALFADGEPDPREVAKFLFDNRSKRWEDWPPTYTGGTQVMYEETAAKIINKAKETAAGG